MNSAIQCIVLLACIAICSSASIMKCQCVKTTQSVKPTLIADVIVHQPRPSCSKYEVIVILKDKSKRCLDPESDFTKLLLKAKEIQRLRR
ncbi:C-X-C motif chemokine 5-like [Anableps anableps]